MITMHYIETQNKLRIDEIANDLPKGLERDRPDVLFNRVPSGIMEETYDLVTNYISEEEFGTVVEAAFDRTIRYLQRDRIQARELVNVQNTDSEFYQWMEGTGFNAYWTTRGAEKRTATFDFASRYARIMKAGLAVQFPEETREAMSIDIMGEVQGKVVEAFDALETDVVMKGLSNGVANGTNYKGREFDTHVIDGASPAFSNPGKLDHDKFLAGEFIMDETKFEGATVAMNNKLFYELMKLEPFKDAQDNWAYLTSPKAIKIVEGESPGKPVLPGIQAKTLVSSPLLTEGEVIMFDPNEYLDFVIKDRLSSKVEPHDGLRDIDTVTYRSRYGIAVRRPDAAVKITNLDGIDVSSIFA